MKKKKKKEMYVLSLGWEDPVEEGMATHPSILAQRIPWTEEPGRLQSTGQQRVDMTEVTQHALMQVSKLYLCFKIGKKNCLYQGLS